LNAIGLVAVAASAVIPKVGRVARCAQRSDSEDEDVDADEGGEAREHESGNQHNHALESHLLAGFSRSC
jgi:hypothetical protein